MTNDEVLDSQPESGNGENASRIATGNRMLCLLAYPTLGSQVNLIANC